MKLIKMIFITVLLFSLSTAFSYQIDPKNSQHNNIYARLSIPSIQLMENLKNKPDPSRDHKQTLSQTTSTTHPITNGINASHTKILKENHSQEQSQTLIQYAKESFEITIILCATLCLIGLSLLRQRG